MHYDTILTFNGVNYITNLTYTQGGVIRVGYAEIGSFNRECSLAGGSVELCPHEQGSHIKRKIGDAPIHFDIPIRKQKRLREIRLELVPELVQRGMRDIRSAFDLDGRNIVPPRERRLVEQEINRILVSQILRQYNSSRHVEHRQSSEPSVHCSSASSSTLHHKIFSS